MRATRNRDRKEDIGKRHRQEFWNLCTGLGKIEGLVPVARGLPISGNSRTMSAPTLADIDKGVGRVSDLREALPLTELHFG